MLLLLLASLLPSAESSLPSDVQQAFTAYDGDVAKFQAEFDKSVLQRAAKLRALLVKAQEAATKKGKLEEALAVKGAIEKLDAGLPQTDLLDNKLPAAGAGAGIQVRCDGTTTTWDNQSPLAMTTSPHDLTFSLKLGAATKYLAIRAKQGYGCERVLIAIDGRSGEKMAKEYSAEFQTAKQTFRIIGTHTGSNDAFSYGPLQYRTSPDGEWANIPPALIVAK